MKPGFALVCILAVAAPVRAAGSADEVVRRAAATVNPAGRLYRVGLDVDHRLIVDSSAPYTIEDPVTGSPAWRDSYRGPTALIAEGGPEGEPTAVYRVQVGAYGTEAAAQAERAKLAARFGVPAVVHYVPDRGSWRVRLGAASSRTALAPLLDKLRAAGRTGMWIAEEPVPASGPVTIRLVDADWNSRLTATVRLVAVPSPGSLLAVGGKTYRGAIEFRVDASGRIRAIDWVELESYLRGVVPSELGPSLYPQLQALEAQAVAARTYAVAHLGQFEEEGFDICATPRCQAYGGAAAEHPLSDRAVAATAGEIALWEGKPIDALYTATCGGHTEDAKEIFPEQAAPYLRGVPCRAEAQVLAREKMVIAGAPPEALSDGDGRDVTRDGWLLAACGVFGKDTRHLARELRRPVAASTLRRWTEAVARLSGRPEPSGPPIAPDTLPRAALALARDLGWDTRAGILLDDADLPGLLRDPAALALPDDARRALAYLASKGAVSPAPDGRWDLDRAPSGARIVRALARIGEAYDAFPEDEGTAVALDGGALTVVRGFSRLHVPLAARPRLFTAAGDRPSPVSALALWPGDRLRYHRDDAGRIDLLELRPPLEGLSDDRSSTVYSWEVRRSASELQDAVDQRLSVGTLRDLRPTRRGVSGRIVELTVVGTEGTAVVRGFDVRKLLDLRESLTVIELQRDAAGRIVAGVFAGKGWGHGVGLCQVGAYGMALRGADYKTILRHYYPGITLGPIPPDVFERSGQR